LPIPIPLARYESGDGFQLVGKEFAILPDKLFCLAA